MYKARLYGRYFIFRLNLSDAVNSYLISQSLVILTENTFSTNHDTSVDDIFVDFRVALVTRTNSSTSLPNFAQNRCLIAIIYLAFGL